MNIRTKILGGFIIVVILGASLGIIGALSIQNITGMVADLHGMQDESNAFANILNAHYTWRNNLTETVMTGKEFSGSLDPRGCGLGLWLSSEEFAKITDPELKRLLDGIFTPHDAIHNGAGPLIDKLAAGDNVGAIEDFNHVILPNFNTVISTLNQVRTRYELLVGEKNDDIVSQASATTMVLWIIIGCAVAIALSIGFGISGAIAKPLKVLYNFMQNAGSTGNITLRPEDMETIKRYSQVKDEVGRTISSTSLFISHITNISDELESVAGGNLTTKVEVLSEEDVMGNSLNHMVQNLNSMFGEIIKASGQVEKEAEHISVNASSISESTTNIAQGAQVLAKGSTDQASSVNELSVSAGEIATKTQANTEMAIKAAKLADTVIMNAQKGSRQMEDMIKAVNDITAASQEINTIIGTINEIASQTNLLSLNASIEAARAGEHGRGFAVVASEVGKLAIESTEAAQETNAIIQTSIEKAELGAKIVDETAVSLKEIIAGIEESSQLIKDIASASDEQLAGINRINSGIHLVSDIVDQNSATAEESAAASEECAAAAVDSTAAAAEMAKLAKVLHDLVARFRLA